MTTIWEACGEALGETPHPTSARREGYDLPAVRRRRRSLRSSGRPGGQMPVTRRPGRHAALALAGPSQCRDGLG